MGKRKNLVDVVLGFREGDIQGIDKYCDDQHCSYVAHTAPEIEFLKNEMRILKQIDGLFAPKFVDFREEEGVAELTVTSIGESVPVSLEGEFRRSCAFVLNWMKKMNIKHGDLTTSNIINVYDRVFLVDFKQSTPLDAPFSKRPEPDAYWMWKSAQEISPDTSRHLRRWSAMREHIDFSNPIVDLGCDLGDFCGFAVAELEHDAIVGVDKNKDAIHRAREIWKPSPIMFVNQNIVSYVEKTTPKDSTIFLLSVFPYIYHDFGGRRARGVLKTLLKNGNEIFFETQLSGDGPGPKMFYTDVDVYNYLDSLNASVQHIVRLPVNERNTTRSVWKLWK